MNRYCYIVLVSAFVALRTFLVAAEPAQDKINELQARYIGDPVAYAEACLKASTAQPEEDLLWTTAIAGAWVLAGDATQADLYVNKVRMLTTDQKVLTDEVLSLRIAYWRLQVDVSEDLSQQASIFADIEQEQQAGRCSSDFLARAAVAEADRSLRLEDFAQALVWYDKALLLMQELSVRSRQPIYGLRLLAMEASGQTNETIQEWFAEKSTDPAVKEIVSFLSTEAQSLVGQVVPALSAMRVDGKGLCDVRALKGAPVLVYFFATWAPSCVHINPLITTSQMRYAGQGLQIIGVSLDHKESMAQIGPYLQAHGLTFPVVADGAGWQGGLHKPFGIEAIPQIILVDAKGVVQATDIVTMKPEHTKARLQEALTRLFQKHQDKKEQVFP